MALSSVSVTALANGNEANGTPVVFQFERSGNAETQLSIDYQLYGTAKSGTDFTGPSVGTVTFAVGSSTVNLSLPVISDHLTDPGETIILGIIPSSAYIITQGKQSSAATISAEGMIVGPNTKPKPFLDLSYSGYNLDAFAALKSDGSVVTWGSPWSGGDSSNVITQLSSGVVEIFSTGGAFAALKSDGSVITWGSSDAGGDSSGVSDKLSSGVKLIFNNQAAFAALKSDGSVVTWGSALVGGDSNNMIKQLSAGVVEIFSTGGAFAALKSDGSVVTWGSSYSGGDSKIAYNNPISVSKELASDVKHVFSNSNAFAAIKRDGSVITWGNPWSGGDSSKARDKLRSGVIKIFSSFGAFAALKSDGSVITWGDSHYGGDSSNVREKLTSNVTQIISNGFDFAALKSDGSVVAWGNPLYPSASRDVTGGLSSGVRQIFSNFGAFAALKYDGSVITWGSAWSGGDSSVMAVNPNGEIVSSSVSNKLSSGVTQIFSNHSCFAALKSDGSVITWGSADAGGDSSAVSDKLSRDISYIFSSGRAFAALKTDGSVITWGNIPDSGGDSSNVVSQLSRGVVAFADNLKDDRLTLDSLTPYPAIALTVESSKVAEDDSTSLVYTFTRTGSTVNQVIINYTVSGTAKIGIDYTIFGSSSEAINRTVIMAAGSATASVMVDPTEDSVVESDETVELTLNEGLGYIVGTETVVVGIIGNDDTRPPYVSLVVSPTSVAEDRNTNLVYTFTRHAYTARELIVNYTVSGTASLVASGSDAADYTFVGSSSTASSRTVTFAAGSATAIVTVDPTADTAVEVNETVELTLAEGSGYIVSTTEAVLGTIRNDDVAIPSVSVVALANGNEADGSPVVFNFKRTGDISTALSVAYQLFGTAQAGSDYTGNTTGTISFAAGSASASLSLPALADGALIDPGETIIARIDPAAGYSISTGKQTATATITAEGTVVTLKVSSRAGWNGNGGEALNLYAFAAFKSDGTVVAWGSGTKGGMTPTGLSGVSQIFSNTNAFAALKSDGSVVAWGDSQYGGTAPTGLSGVTQVFSNSNAFAALKGDGTVVAWGDPSWGGTAPTGLSGVSQIFSTNFAFAALKSNGTVVAWGFVSGGGTAPSGLTGVSQIFSTHYAFAALKSDGSVVTWGEFFDGSRYLKMVAPSGLTGVSQIFSNSDAFAALKSDGTVVTWGNMFTGGTAPTGLSGVTQIFSAEGAFAALKSDGTVVAWGNSSGGGTAPTGLSGVIQIFSNSNAFAALKSDGTVVAWGLRDYGGTAPTGLMGVTQIFSNNNAFAALKSDGTVVAWGLPDYGGTAPMGLSGVTQIFSTEGAFAALKSDGTVVAWGNISYGGTAPAGLSGVVGFANPFTDDRLVTTSSSITLAVSPASVTEDGASNLIYTFTRTGATTNALTVNYSIAGTADSTDYTGATPGAGKTITFAAGASTATLTMDPTADSTVESDETVALTLASGTGYTVGTTVAVTGAITNDDTIVTLAVSAASVLEDGVANLVYTFTRTDVTANALTVNYTVGGTATLGTDYTGIAATPATKAVTFAAGAPIALVTVDPTADTTVETDESVALALAAGTGYTVGTETAVVGTIRNDDKLIPIYTVTPSAGTINEGTTLSTIVATTNVPSGTTLYWSVGGTGVSAADFSSGALNGLGVVGTDGKFSFAHTAAKDSTTEGVEKLQIILFSDQARKLQVGSAASVTIKDTSLRVNTKPTVFQLLTDTSKIGRVLTADRSSIVDPDGVPTVVSYGWEVSSNGTTWTKLTSADATDNNSTYALTSSELGKTIRSVISYTDGFGANEVVRSAATTAVVAGNKPTSISLSLSSIVENVGANVAVAKLSSVDVDTDETFKYSLVSGTGSTDNSMFSISGDQLFITGNPNFETKNSYGIRVRTTDLAGLPFDQSFILRVTNINEAPIAISLSDSAFLENSAAGSVIGTLSSVDPDNEAVFTYSLTPSSPLAPSTDNQFFSIVNDQLKINALVNFEQKDTYTISVRSTDAGKLFYDQVFTLVLQDVDEAPTDISITGTSIDEGAAVGSIVGSLLSTDQDGSSTDFTYALVAGTKANNNDLFEIVGEQLKAKLVFNFETKSSYEVNVRTTDESGLTFDKSITVKVNNVNENPTDLTVSATSFNENVAIGSNIATLGFVDPDISGTYTYSLVSGVGDKDNQAFLIAGNALKVNVATNFEIQKSYSVRLRVTDQGGLSLEKAVTLGVNNLVEKVSSGVSTTLASDKDTLELTGTKNIAGMGNQFDNTIIGNSGKNKLTGGMGKDILKGSGGVDTFFYNDLKESQLSGFDVITDYAAGEKISLANPLFEGDDLIASAGMVSALNVAAIGSVLTNTTFLANNALAFTVKGLSGIFLALNDGRDGFQADSDALIHLSNYTIGSTTPISII